MLRLSEAGYSFSEPPFSSVLPGAVFCCREQEAPWLNVALVANGPIRYYTLSLVRTLASCSAQLS